MIQNVKSTLTGILMVVAVQHLKADQTNLVQDLSIRLTGITQGPTETNGHVVKTTVNFTRVNTSDVIKQLGTATGNGFSTKARLVVVTPLPDGNSGLLVRDGTKSVDVSSFFVYEQKSGFIGMSETNLKTGRSTGNDYSIQRLALEDSGAYAPLSLHFDVQGIAVESSSSSTAGARTELDASVTGAGDQNGKLTLLEGSFSVQGHSLEVVTTAPPPPNT